MLKMTEHTFEFEVIKVNSQGAEETFEFYTADSSLMRYTRVGIAQKYLFLIV